MPTTLPQPISWTQIEEELFGIDVFSINSLGVRHVCQEWAETLKHLAIGPFAGATEEGNGALAVDMRGGIAACSRIFVYDCPQLLALSENGFVDGHVVFVPLQVMVQKMKDVSLAAQWIGDGAVACARVALDMVGETPEWKKVDRSAVREALANLPSGDHLLSVWQEAPQEDAWRYGSTIRACAKPDERNNPLVLAAGAVMPVALESGWANRQWKACEIFQDGR